jgi:BirA family biotin operon repressor/biotin-[acetyl-CoA-carboxylase] ligase
MLNVLYFKEVDSTMDAIKEYPFNTVIVAENQTKGRGKTARQWESLDAKNVYLSIKIKVDTDNCFNCVFAVGTIVLKTLKYFFQDINLKLKWPNDVLLNDKKIAGILLEGDISNNSLIIGLGLNLNSSPSRTIFRATSLKEEGYSLDKKEFLDIFIKTFGNYNLRDFLLIRKEWMKYAFKLKEEIKVNDINGIFEELDADGSLILRINKNEIIKISSGDVFTMPKVED